MVWPLFYAFPNSSWTQRRRPGRKPRKRLAWLQRRNKRKWKPKTRLKQARLAKLRKRHLGKLRIKSTERAPTKATTPMGKTPKLKSRQEKNRMVSRIALVKGSFWGVNDVMNGNRQTAVPLRTTHRAGLSWSSSCCWAHLSGLWIPLGSRQEQPDAHLGHSVWGEIYSFGVLPSCSGDWPVPACPLGKLLWTIPAHSWVLAAQMGD